MTNAFPVLVVYEVHVPSITGLVNVLFVNVWVVPVPTIVVFASGNVKVLVVLPDIPEHWNWAFLVVSELSWRVKLSSSRV